MGTTVQKLQRILETKTGFKNLITEKGGVITETTTFHEYIDEARKLMEGGSVVLEREGSITPVPNAGFVEKICFNTDLTPTEVDAIISKLTFTEIEGMSVYVIFADVNGSIMFFIQDVGGMTIDDTVISGPAYIIWASGSPLYVSSCLSEFMNGIDGWYTDIFSEIGSNEIPLNLQAAQSHMDVMLGTQNKIIKELVNVGSTEPYYKELSGTYEAVDIDITGNGEIDLTTYIDNDQIPININIAPILQSKEVAPTTSSQIITADNDYDGLQKVTIDAVTSAIDDDIKPENIIKGVNILGVTGTYIDHLKQLLNTTKSARGLFSNYTYIYNYGEYPYSNLDKAIYTSNTISTFENILNYDTTSEVENFQNMFSNANFNCGVPYFDTSKGRFFDQMFQSARFTDKIDFSKLNLENARTLYAMFSNASDLVPENIELNLPSATMACNMFANCTTIKNASITIGYTYFSTYKSGYDSYDVSHPDHIFSGIFHSCTNLEKAYLSVFDNYNLPNTSYNKKCRCREMCYNCTSLTEIEIDLNNKGDFSGIDALNFAFKGCVNLKTITFKNILNNNLCTTFYGAFEGCESLEETPLLNINGSYNNGTPFVGCKSLKNINFINITPSIQVGSGDGTGADDYGTLLTLECLVKLCQECVNVNMSRTLTVGTANLAKLVNIYVKLTGEPEEDETLPKLPMVQCESTDEGAMLISEYMQLKGWVLA